MKKPLIFIMAILFLQQLHAQKTWTRKNLFSHKDFIENKGQADDKQLPNKEHVLFTASLEGLEFCFTKSGYTVIRREVPEEKEERRTLRSRQKEKTGEADFDKKAEEKFHELKFDGGNPDVQLIAENRVSNYYAYPDLKSPDKKGTLFANAYSKLTYRNIYPFTDIVFEFPADSSGIKYSIYLHPGADVNNVRMTFPLSPSLKLSKDELLIGTAFGKMTDHAPVSFLQKSKSPVKSRFSLSDGAAGFRLNRESSEETIVIDPWTTVPAFSGGFSDAYDIDYDNAGNAYVYGGVFGGPLSLLKYDPAGTLVWTYVPTLFSGYYGDFAVDRNSGNIYLVEGFNSFTGSQVIKLNPSATLLASYPGDPQFIEMWRISFSRCSNQAVIAGGGVSNPTYQTCYLDTSLTSLTNVQYVPTTNCCHDVNMLALDNYGNCYQVTNLSSSADGLFENVLVKLPLPSLLPVTYSVPSGYAFQEANSNIFYGGGFGNYCNGFNGLTTSNTKVFSYDSYVLKKWDGPTGALLTYKRIHYPLLGDSSQTHWSGIAADDCGNLFVSDSNMVRQYDTTLTLINSYTMPGVVIDISLSNSGQLYVCGLGFATSLLPTGMINCSSGGTLGLSTTSSDATCTSPGSATAIITGGSPPYNIVWNTSPPQFGTTITGVPPGVYTVTVTEASCLVQTLIDTVTIGATGGAFYSTPLITTGCPGSVNSGAITVSPSGGVLPYSYSWSTGPGDTTNTITGLAPGTYTLTITDSAGCTNSYSSLVVDTATGVAYTFSGNVNCNGDTTTVSINLSGGSPPYSVNWTSPSASGTVIHGVNAGILTGNITDASGCVQPFTYTLTQPPLFTASSISSYTCSVPNSGVITVSASGGNNPYTYSWTGFPANTTNTNSSLPPGIYTVTVTDSNLCVITLTDTIENYSPLVINGITSSACFGGSNGSVTVNPSGGNGSSYQYSWTGIPGNTGNAVSPAAPGTYTVSVVSGSCTASATFTVNENAIVDTLNLSTSYCKGEATTSLTIPGASQGPYQWYNGGIGIPGATGNSYTTIVGLVNGYSVTWFLNGCGYTTSGVDSTVFPFLTGTTKVNVFSPNSDGENELFYPFVEQAQSPSDNFFAEYHLQIFDRWGLKMFETTSSSQGWNGTNMKNKKLNDGVYFWIVEAKSNCHDKEILEKGTVHIVR
jgi:gliding motility-associated-like protein